MDILVNGIKKILWNIGILYIIGRIVLNKYFLNIFGKLI